MRQYIGARYVPKYFENTATGDSTWAANTVYEPLTIVLYNEAFYTSKKKVPATVGAPNSNTEYWVFTAAVTGGAGSLAQRVNELENWAEDTDDSIDQIDGDLTYAQQSIAALQSQIATIGAKKWIFIGDSYGHASGTNNGWIDKIISKLGLSSGSYYESGVGGASFGGSTNFLTQITAIAGELDAPTKASITDIVVLGGTNELGFNVDVIKSGIDSFVSYCKTNFPNAKIRLGCVYGTTNPQYVVVQYGRALEAYSSASGVEFLNNLQFVLNNRDYINTDGIHPTSAGYDALANALYNALMGGYNCFYSKESTPTAESGYSMSIAGTTMKVYVSNDVTTIIAGARVGCRIAEGTFTFAQGNLKKICNINNPLFLGSQAIGVNSPFVTTVRATFSFKDGTTKSVMGIATCFRGSVWFYSTDPVLGTTTAFQNCTALTLDNFCITGPTACA